jgi:hypothetical protein
LLLVLSAVGVVGDGWDTARQLWQEHQRPAAVYRRAIHHGLAISLNDLEKRRERGGQLPGLDIRGVLLDTLHQDWILFGEAAPERSGLLRDAVAIALRAVRLHLEAPGIDIQPRRGAAGADEPVQEVKYFGGVDGTVVGAWFFRFDYWMKRLSLGQEPMPVAGVPVYWHRAVEALEREVAACQTTELEASTRHNRYWLCAGSFPAIEDDDTLVFESTPLQVLTESLHDTSTTTAGPAVPCGSRGTSDPLAAEFAHQLTAHLARLSGVVPVAEIEDFTRLLAGLAWLADVDPYRDLHPWLRAPVTHVDTPDTVSTLTMQAMREHTVAHRRGFVVHQHRIELSGGVLVAPSLIRARASDDALRRLRRAVLTARPADAPGVWRFTFSPPSS